MRKFLESLKNINVPMACFVALTARLVIFGGDMSVSVALFALASLYGFTTYIFSKDLVWKKAVENEIGEIKATLSRLTFQENMKKSFESRAKTAQPKTGADQFRKVF